MSPQQRPNRKRVLYLTWRDLDHPEGGGAELYAERTAAELVRQGHDVTMFSSRWSGAARRVERDGFTIIRRGGRYGVYVAGLLHLLVRRHRYDAVVDVQNGVPFWSPLVFRGRIVNLTHHVHREQWSWFSSTPVARLGWFLESRLAPWAYRRHRYVTVSMSSRDELVSLGIDVERISVAFGGIDLPDGYAETKAIARSEHPSLVTICRLVPHKRIEMAITALRRLLPSIPDLTLHVVGDGTSLAPLRTHASHEGVADHVVFHGFVDDAQKHAELARAWAMAMPSLKEGWGLTIIEAALHSTPTVAFHHAGGTRESIQDHVTGLLADDEEEFVEGLHRLLTDADYRHKLGSNARDHALRFNWQRTGSDLMRAIEADS